MTVSIREQLRILREGDTSVEPIMIEVNPEKIFLESIIFDVQSITESAKLLIESGQAEEVKKNKLRKMVEWLIQKIRKFIMFISEKFRQLFKHKFKKEDYSFLEDSDGIDVETYTGIVTGKIRLREIIGKIKGSLNDSIAMSISKENHITEAIYTKLLKVNMNNVVDSILGDFRSIKINVERNFDKITKAMDEAKYAKMQIQDILSEISNKLGKLSKDLVLNRGPSITEISDKIDYYSSMAHICMIMDRVANELVNNVLIVLNAPKRKKEIEAEEEVK